jgi:hypothetical protein
MFCRPQEIYLFSFSILDKINESLKLNFEML